MANNVRGLIINSLKQYHDEIKNGLITSSERTNWNSYANVQADWNATSGYAYIKNKPIIPAASKVFKKISGSWCEQTSFTNIFESNKIYINK